MSRAKARATTSSYNHWKCAEEDFVLLHRFTNTVSQLPQRLGLLSIILFAHLGAMGAQAQAPDTEPAKAEAQSTQAQSPDANGDASETKPTPARQKLDPQARQLYEMEQLAKRHEQTGQEQEELLWLGEGEERFLSIYQAAAQPLPQGAALILHGNKQHPRWPQTMSVLSDSLAQHGWTTLSLSLPVAYPEKHPERPEPIPTSDMTDTESKMAEGDKSGTESSSKDAGEESPAMMDKTTEPAENSTPSPNTINDSEMAPSTPMMAEEAQSEPYRAEEQALQRLGLVYDYLRQQGLLNMVIISEGNAALRASQLLQSIPQAQPSRPGARVAGPVAAIIMINAQNKRPNDPDSDLAAQLKSPDLPMLDLYFGNAKSTVNAAKRRKLHAQREGYRVYRQQRIPQLNNQLSLGENRLSKTVRGFLAKHARGKAKTLP